MFVFNGAVCRLVLNSLYCLIGLAFLLLFGIIDTVDQLDF